MSENEPAAYSLFEEDVAPSNEPTVYSWDTEDDAGSESEETDEE